MELDSHDAKELLSAGFQVEVSESVYLEFIEVLENVYEQSIGQYAIIKVADRVFIRDLHFYGF